MIADPPLYVGADQPTLSWALPETSVGLAGASGADFAGMGELVDVSHVEVVLPALARTRTL